LFHETAPVCSFDNGRLTTLLLRSTPGRYIDGGFRDSLHGKEGVDGSSPSEGSAKAPHNGAFCFGSRFAGSRTWGRYGALYGAFRSKTRSWRGYRPDYSWIDLPVFDPDVAFVTSGGLRTFRASTSSASHGSTRAARRYSARLETTLTSLLSRSRNLTKLQLGPRLPRRLALLRGLTARYPAGVSLTPERSCLIKPQPMNSTPTDPNR